jgi:hypothetical protein
MTKIDSINQGGLFPSFIGALKDLVDEDINYEQQISFYKKSYPSIYDLQFLQQSMFILPLPFNKEHKNMLAYCKEMLENHNGQVAIHHGHSNLFMNCTREWRRQHRQG